MNLNQASKTTQKLLDKTNEMNEKVMETTRMLQDPTTKAARMGMKAGMIAGSCLLVVSGAQLITGRPLWALGSAAAGTCTILSNQYAARRAARKEK